MQLKIAQVIGLNTDQKAAQVTSTTLEDTTFLAILDLSSDDAFTRGRQVLSELSDFFFESEGAPAEKLKATFAEGKQKFADGEFSLCLASFCGKALYLLGSGNVEVYLKREDKISALFSTGASEQLISGFMNPGDRLLFATTSLITFLGDDFKSALSSPVETFKEELESKIGASDLESKSLAALAAEVGEEEEQQPREEAVDSAASSLPASPRPSLFEKLGPLFDRAKTYFPKSNRSRLIIAVVLILILIAGAGLKYKAVRDNERNLQFNKILSDVRENFEAAKGLASLNPQDAKVKLDAAKDLVNKALAQRPKNQDALNLKQQIEQQAPNILQQSSVSDFPVFLDLDLIKKNFQATQMSLSGNKLLLLDPAVKTLISVDIAKKSNQTLAGSEQLGQADFASLNGGLAFVYSEDKGILRIDTQNSKVSSVSKKDSDWGQIKDIYAFAGNIYVLDSAKNQIWKYLPTTDGYSDLREYLSKDAKVDFASAIRMQIESSVYVLKSGGEIIRFTKGDKDNFSYSGLPSSVKGPKSFFVSSDTDNLYLLDSGNSRLLILTKTGAYKGQISGSKFAAVTDLAVDEVVKKVYLLEGSKIYTVDLK